MRLLCAEHLLTGDAEVEAATVWNGRAVCRECLTSLSDRSTTEGWDVEESRDREERRAVDDLRRSPRTNR
ncbi:hypothetical protein CLV37_1072 [Kineococcus rhizosphaerae]|uniref:Uncharacterized protein n=1 Tax=Kineococcus rhizosphaerae TaxID=559628 RepID=A0A2T0R277_9ACTN|nr:hypothetical protein CLV37_1072 [Kineococcus rhizosphaerae]